MFVIGLFDFSVAISSVSFCDTRTDVSEDCEVTPFVVLVAGAKKVKAVFLCACSGAFLFVRLREALPEQIADYAAESGDVGFFIIEGQVTFDA